MAFDQTNQTDLNALKSEVINDPLGMGYNPDDTNGLLRLLNDPDNNVGGETTGADLTVALLLEAIDPSDFVGNQVTDGERVYLQAFMIRDLSDNIEAYRAKIVSALPAQSGTVAALNAQSRPLSRGEVLFGEETSISRQDWIAARDGGVIA